MNRGRAYSRMPQIVEIRENLKMAKKILPYKESIILGLKTQFNSRLALEFQSYGIKGENLLRR